MQRTSPTDDDTTSPSSATPLVVNAKQEIPPTPARFLHVVGRDGLDSASPFSGPMLLTVDRRRRHIYVAERQACVRVIDCQSFSTIGFINNYSIANAVGVAVNWNGHVAVTCYSTSMVYVLDPDQPEPEELESQDDDDSNDDGTPFATSASTSVTSTETPRTPTREQLAVTLRSKRERMSMLLNSIKGSVVHGGRLVQSFASNKPAGIATIESLRQYVVCEKDLNRVVVFDEHGSKLYTIGSIGSKPGFFQEPIGVCVCERTERMFVSERSNHRIQTFDLHGCYLSDFAVDKTTKLSGVALDLAGNLVTADLALERIFLFATNGDMLWSWRGALKCFERPYGVAVNLDGNILVTFNSIIGVFRGVLPLVWQPQHYPTNRPEIQARILTVMLLNRFVHEAIASDAPHEQQLAAAAFVLLPREILYVIFDFLALLYI